MIKIICGFQKVRVWVNKNECDKQFLNLLNERDAELAGGGPSTSSMGKGKRTKQPLKLMAKSSKPAKSDFKNIFIFIFKFRYK